MPLLIIHAVIACVSLITPRRATESIQRIFTNIALARANARYLAVAASGTQHEPSSRQSFTDAPAEANRATS
ncbi:hypothetical protein CJ177_36215 [Rhodococcus sp. ACPA1]|nr:hypothetical protein CJ177_36215 [Rhodococcus sp. ACPA1]RZI53960.1 MAG: hypothetical protein EOP16_00375 [Pseudonocardia sp.]